MRAGRAPKCAPIPDTAQARTLQQELARAIVSLRRTGTLPSGLPAGVAGTFSRTGSGTLLEQRQVDRYDPAAVAATLPAHTGVLFSCSNADGYFGCAEVGHLAAGPSKAPARLDFVHLNGVGHFLKEDITKNPGGIQPAASVLCPAARRADDVPGHQPLSAE